MYKLLDQSAAQNQLLSTGLRPGQTDTLIQTSVFLSLYCKYLWVIIVRDSGVKKTDCGGIGEGVTETLTFFLQNRKFGGTRCRLKAICTNSIAAFVCVCVLK